MDATREETSREAIERLLQQVGQLVEKNNLVALRLRGLLLGELPEGVTPATSPRSGWLGAIEDVLEIMYRYSSDTAATLKYMHQQVEPQETVLPS